MGLTGNPFAAQSLAHLLEVFMLWCCRHRFCALAEPLCDVCVMSVKLGTIKSDWACQPWPVFCLKIALRSSAAIHLWL